MGKNHKARFRGDVQIDGQILGPDGEPVGGSSLAEGACRPIDAAGVELLEGSVPNGDDDFAATQKIHVPTDASLYIVQALAQERDSSTHAYNSGLVVIENAAHWDHWWGDGDNFDYPTAEAMEDQFTFPGGVTPSSFQVGLQVLVPGGWYVFPFHAYVTHIAPLLT